MATDEWITAAVASKFRAALKAVNPGRQRGPWEIASDNESLLHARGARAAHAQQSISLMHIPARSLDLNPIEKCWAWARARLRAMDLKDAAAKRRPLGKMTYRARVLVL